MDIIQTTVVEALDKSGQFTEEERKALASAIDDALGCYFHLTARGVVYPASHPAAAKVAGVVPPDAPPAPQPAP